MRLTRIKTTDSSPLQLAGTKHMHFNTSGLEWLSRGQSIERNWCAGLFVIQNYKRINIAFSSLKHLLHQILLYNGIYFNGIFLL